MAGYFRRLDNDEDLDVIVRTDSTEEKVFCVRKSICYLVIIVILSVVVFSLAIALALSEVRKSAHQEKGNEASYTEIHTCNKTECYVLAGAIISQMNLSADPCEDFYEYACGNFIATQVLEQSQKKLDRFYLLQQQAYKFVYKKLMAEEKLFGLPSSALKKAQTIHQQCLNQIDIERAGVKPIINMIKRYGGWPLGNEQMNLDQWMFNTTLLEIHQSKITPFINFYVGADDKNSSTNLINVYQSGLTLHSDKDYNATRNPEAANRNKDAFIKYGTEVFRLLGINESKSAEAMTEIYHLEKRLADIFIPQEALRNPNISYAKFTVKEMQNIIGPRINVLHHVSGLFNRTFSDDLELVTYSTNYLKNLSAVLEEYLNNSSTKRVVMNYLIWIQIHKQISLLSSGFQYAHLILKNVTEGVTSDEERWFTCTKAVDDLMPKVTGALYLGEKFGSEDREQVTNIINKVRERYIEKLQKYDWMDEATRSAAVRKAKLIDMRVGYPDYVTNVTHIDTFYEKLVVADNYFDSVNNHRKWLVSKQAEDLSKPVDKTKWDMSVPTINAYYNPAFNQVVLPAGILQAPFYDKDLPLAWNYGATGSVIGHEMTHGFDDMGSQYDENGNLRNWWSNSSLAAFREASKCILDQYASYKVANTPLNSLLNIGENIADNGGVLLSYETYLAKVSSGYQRVKLPGLDLTDSQLFFLAFAQIWCRKITPQYEQSSINSNPHSPSNFRVQGVYSNMEAFSSVYGCKAGSVYNPKTRCAVW